GESREASIWTDPGRMLVPPMAMMGLLALPSHGGGVRTILPAACLLDTALAGRARCLHASHRRSVPVLVSVPPDLGDRTVTSWLCAPGISVDLGVDTTV